MTAKDIFSIPAFLLIIMSIAGFAGIFKNQRWLIISALLSFICAVIGLIIRSPQLQTPQGNAGDAFLSPAIYMCIYLFIKVYVERSFGKGFIYLDRKKMTASERSTHIRMYIFVHVIPFLIAMLLPILISGEMKYSK